VTRPPASLVLTVLNEAQSIEQFLDSIASQSWVPAEIVVVDGGSSDGTAAALGRWTPPVGCEVKVIVAEGAGISRGRNVAVAAARFDRILVTDAGTVLESDWVELMLRAFDREPAPDVVSGFYHPSGETFLERTIAFTVTHDLAEVNPESFLPSSRSLAFTRDAWEAGGGYPEWLDYCEDLVFDISMRDVGMRFAFEPRARVYWSARPTIRAFMKQYYRYARGDGKAGLWPRRHAIRYSAYIGGGLLALAGMRTVWGPILLAVGIATYMRTPIRRILRRRDMFGSRPVAAAAIAPAIVIAGDIAKMVGYPVGVIWRARKRILA
jgi:glycosyltransferase involved in cell wall biosynthesis